MFEQSPFKYHRYSCIFNYSAFESTTNTQHLSTPICVFNNLLYTLLLFS